MEKVKVRMLVSIAGNADPMYDLPDFAFAPRQIVELHPQLAEAWIANGKAERFVEPKAKKETVEAAVAPPIENAMQPPPVPRPAVKAPAKKA